MKSSQIIFYMTDADILEIEKYLQETEFLILHSVNTDAGINPLSSLLDVPEYSKNKTKCLIEENDKDRILFRYSETKKLYFIDIIHSPVIEFSSSSIQEEGLVRGRLYYVKDFYDKENQLTSKNESFLSQASSLFRWVKKNFPNAKLDGYEDFLVTERIKQWQEKTGGKLVLNHFQKKKEIVTQ